ncbi:MAG: Rrf2 family transcriptional regulator [Thermoanaerobaculaceae bacterium]|nr:Rrf2 family transcriptional regulator [Thermoanaerobaculaceae bacterium]MDI9620950.1 Rrf2 family transcriptional regulator [Acidobacteriota bacterium]NLH09846.1 Rrf2 family transcriptional regulator [Holophagae bacterium]HPW56425.1 Rrf2 family transcriptional regulator [Thermoanaerobaculaceae bacterium]
MSGALTTASSHALRALTPLAAAGDRVSVLGRDLARDAETPADNLSKNLLALSRTGMFAATRGSRGGHRLGTRPSEIRQAYVRVLENTTLADISLNGRRSWSKPDAGRNTAQKTIRAGRAAGGRR